MRSLTKQAVLFDLDGTLLDTTPLIYASYRHAVQTVLGYVPQDTDIRASMGKTLLGGMQIFAPDRVEELMQVYREFNIANHRSYVSPFPQAATTLTQLRLTGMRLGVVTSKRRDVARLGLAITGLWGFFDVFICEDDTPRHKPDPYPIWLACAHLGVPANQCAFVGDTTADMAAAQAAGCLPVAVAWSECEELVLRQAGAAIYLQSLPELLQMEDLLQYREPFYSGCGVYAKSRNEVFR